MSLFLVALIMKCNNILTLIKPYRKVVSKNSGVSLIIYSTQVVSSNPVRPTSPEPSSLKQWINIAGVELAIRRP